MSRLEDVDVVLDFGQNAIRFESRHRPGALYSLEGVVLIDQALLAQSQVSTQFVAVALGPEADPATLARLDTALGVGLSRQLAGGAWPTHPRDLVMSLTSAASSISLDEAGRTLRFVLEPKRYFDAFADGDAEPDDAPPIFDVTINDDGSVGRIVVRVPDSTNLAKVPLESDGYAVDYDYTSPTELDVPALSLRSPVDVEELPLRATEIPCELEP